MDIIIPALIMAGFAALITYSTIKERRGNRCKEKTKEEE